MTEGSAVFLKNRLVLTPQLFDRAGLVYPTRPLAPQNFEITIDLEISNQKKSQLSHGAF